MSVDRRTGRGARAWSGRGARAWSLLAAGSLALLLASSSAGAGAPKPSVTGVAHSNVTASSAVFSGYVDPRGAPTDCFFEYGTTTAYGLRTPAVSVGSGSGEVRVSQAVAGLAPATAYHLRIVAASSGGTTVGADHLFTTARVPLSLQAVVVPPSVRYGGSFAVEGTLSGTGAAGHAVELQVNQYPYAGMERFGEPAVTDGAGHFHFSVVGVSENAHLRVLTVGSPTVKSTTLIEHVTLRVSLHARRLHRRKPGRFYLLYGVVSPAGAGAQVGFQLIRPGLPSVNQGGARVRPAGSRSSRFAVVVRIRRGGDYEALVTTRNGAFTAGYSAPVRLGQAATRR